LELLLKEKFMKEKIDTSILVRFYDDRGREESYFLKDVVYEDDNFCLCTASFMQGSLFGVEDKTVKFEENVDGYEDKRVLFDKDTHAVLTNNLDSHYAENIKNL
jgi:hypothetical protein